MDKEKTLTECCKNDRETSKDEESKVMEMQAKIKIPKKLPTSLVTIFTLIFITFSTIMTLMKGSDQNRANTPPVSSLLQPDYRNFTMINETIKAFLM